MHRWHGGGLVAGLERVSSVAGGEGDDGASFDASRDPSAAHLQFMVVVVVVAEVVVCVDVVTVVVVV